MLLHCWWECKLIQLLWNTVWRCLKKLGIKPPYDSAITLLGIYPEEINTENDTRTTMFTAALFKIARTWTQPRRPLTEEWIKKLWYIYTMEYYSAIKRNTFESVPMRWMKLEPIITQPGALLQNHSVSYLDRLGARDDDRGFVEDIDPHDGPILLSPGNQSDAKEAVNYQRCEHHQINRAQLEKQGAPSQGWGALKVLEPRFCLGVNSAELHPPLASVSISMKTGFLLFFAPKDCAGIQAISWL